MDWTHDDEITLSYYRLLSRSKALTEEMSVDRERLEEKFLSLGFGRFPGGVEYIRACREEREQNVSTAAELGRKGGLVTSEKKARAVRENGKKGGRPAKNPDLDVFG